MKEPIRKFKIKSLFNDNKRLNQKFPKNFLAKNKKRKIDLERKLKELERH